MKITKAEFDRLFDDNIKKKEYDAIIEKIDARFSEICEKFLVKLRTDSAWFDYDNVGYGKEASDGHFDPEDYKEYIGVGGEWCDPPPGYDAEFPTRWLWEDFEEELKETIQAAKLRAQDEKRKAKEKKQARKEKLEALKVSIKSKLTPEELKAIKFKA